MCCPIVFPYFEVFDKGAVLGEEASWSAKSEDTLIISINLVFIWG